MTNISRNAMQLVRPFAYIGIDFTGHIFLSDESGRISKYYILVYTCLTIRAVYLDVLPSMSTMHCLQSFKRFCDRFTIPIQVMSDNFSSFTQMGRILMNSFEADPFKEFLEKCNIKHVQIPVRAAWVGAAYEVMVKLIKRCLYKAIG